MPNLFTDPSDAGLSRYGWTTSLDHAFAAHREAGLVPARIARVDRGLCDAVTGSGPVRADLTALHSPDPLLAPCTGDWAALRPGREPRLLALLPRHSAIVRSSASRTSHGQVLAANVDTVAIAVSLAAPLDAARLERDCRFGDCAHGTEPGCAVRAAIRAGELTERRLDSYRKLQRENAWAASRTDARLRGDRVNRQKAITSHLRATYRFRDRQS
ncbi:hypothetical protein ACBJ59_22945 [Nonomuraea sp. MTCD27]|uniref:hypothetical protein n=1 Tax=Nonomuraea sp. MTCD27 TaxID=1676747 RepID=UPI0035C0DF12